MKILMKLFISALLMSFPLLAEELTKSSVKHMIEVMDKAADKMDVRTITDYIHPNASITMNITINGQTQVMRVTKAQYVQLLNQGLQAAASYSHEVTDIDITIKDGKAFAAMQVTEMVEINGEKQEGKSQENLTIEKIGGKLMITGIVAFTNL